jgi:hypothetical protein
MLSLNPVMKNKFIASSILVTLVALAAAAISLAQSASQSPGRASNPSLSQTEYYSRLRSGTLASNLKGVGPRIVTFTA